MLFFSFISSPLPFWFAVFAGVKMHPSDASINWKALLGQDTVVKLIEEIGNLGKNNSLDT